MEVLKEDFVTKKHLYKPIMEDFKRDKNNFVILTKGKYNNVIIDVGEYSFVHSWIELKDSNLGCLVKNFTYNIVSDRFLEHNGKQGMSISKYNNILVPYIGTEIFSIETVKYFFAKFAKGGQKIMVNPYLEYLITLDEKKNGEEVCEGIDVLLEQQQGDTLVFSERLNAVKKFLELRHIATHTIQSVEDEFIRQEIFKKTVGYKDNHNINWSIGVNGKNIRMFPAYDFDFCSGVVPNREIETLADNGNTDLKSFIEQYKSLPWMKKYIEEVIQNFNIQHVISESYNEIGIPIPTQSKEYFEEYYSEKKKEIQSIYKEILQDRGDDEICI